LALPHLSDKERVVIEKNHIAIYVTCLWKWSKRWAYRQRNEQKICNHKYRVDKRIWTERKKSLLASHYASWEWLITLNQKIGYHGVGVYKIKQQIFDKLIRDIRSKYTPS
jgi:KDO2-lipid IV(A) lauroyltransferase